MKPILYSWPLDGKTNGLGNRLADFLGLDGYEELASRFDLRWLIDFDPGRDERGTDDFPMREAANRAQDEQNTWVDGQTVVLCGRYIQQAFLSIGEPLDYTYRETVDGGNAVVVHLPLPSVYGWWGEPENQGRVRRLLSAHLLERRRP